MYVFFAIGCRKTMFALVTGVQSCALPISLRRGREMIGKGGARHEDGARLGQVQRRDRRHRTRRIAVGYEQPAPCDVGARTLPACSPAAVEHHVDTTPARALPHPAGSTIKGPEGNPLAPERLPRIGDSKTAMTGNRWDVRLILT